MSDINYKVYDPESDELKFLTDDERNLLDLLQGSEEFLFTRIINQHLNESNDWIDSLDRLREIFKFLFRHHRTFQSERRMVYFLDRPGSLSTLIRHVEGLWLEKDNNAFGSNSMPLKGSSDFVEDDSIKKEKKYPSTITNETNPHLSLETLMPISKLNFLRTLLVKHQVLAQHTFTWNDKSVGYKGRISAFIQVLERKGYFGKNRFNGKEVSEILINSFGISVTSKTANESLSNGALLKLYDFIPPFSTIS